MITATYVSATTFTVSGDQTAEFHVGRRVKHIGDTTGYGTIESVSIPVSDTQVVLTAASDDLDASLTGVYYGVVSSYESESSIPIHTHDGDEGSGGGISFIPKSILTADGEIIVGTGAGAYQAESGATALTSLGAMAFTGANLAIGSDADGDMYYRASSVLARLAKGAANTKLFMNAGATAPEWAVGMKIGTFTHDISVTGTQEITGVGFKPSHVIFISTIGGTGAFSVGFDDGTLSYAVADYTETTADTYTISATKAIYLARSGSARGHAHISTIGSDGFTLTWTKDLSPTGTGTVYYFALR